MKNKILRVGLWIHKKLPFIPFEPTLIKIYHSLQDRDKIIHNKEDQKIIDITKQGNGASDFSLRKIEGGEK